MSSTLILLGINTISEVFLWIAHKPGVCHGLKELCGEDQKRQYSEAFAENAISTVFIPDNDLTGDGSSVRNYDCEGDHL